MAAVNEVGNRYGRLVVTSRAESHVTKGGQRKTRWNAICDCGNKTVTQAATLRRGRVTSCGCLQSEIRVQVGRANRREVVTYSAAHRRVRQSRGPASSLACVDCSDSATDWSYNHLDPNELDERVNGYLVHYSLDPAFYEPRCRSCHVRSDFARLRLLDERTDQP